MIPLAFDFKRGLMPKEIDEAHKAQTGTFARSTGKERRGERFGRNHISFIGITWKQVWQYLHAALLW